MLESLVLQNRSYRAFDESAPIGEETMRALVELARKVGSGMNRQPLRYRILCDKADISTMLANCRFASKLPVKLPPANGKPTGFILLFIDREAGSPASLALKDVGIAAQTILLGATAQKIEDAVKAVDPAFPLDRVADLPAAVTAARAMAQEGDIVFFSPASASFDMYKNFEERGRHFCALVKEL